MYLHERVDTRGTHKRIQSCHRDSPLQSQCMHAPTCMHMPHRLTHRYSYGHTLTCVHMPYTCTHHEHRCTAYMCTCMCVCMCTPFHSAYMYAHAHITHRHAHASTCTHTGVPGQKPLTWGHTARGREGGTPGTAVPNPVYG